MTAQKILKSMTRFLCDSWGSCIELC